ncbi:biotin/lipoyl-containing protein [Streptomyces platensis]|uniref:biotin/lipoyl-containing protein n=1 Tax=Streptomyces platensis TaxID=58346 RepID=UPI00386CC136|nr:hypothetical protein OG962_00380 [Streptomyces platensis]
MSTDTLEAQVFPLPDLGEGLTEAEIVEWKVAVGDTVEIDQIVVEVETAKAAVEIPVPYAGCACTPIPARRSRWGNRSSRSARRRPGTTRHPPPPSDTERRNRPGPGTS